MYRNIRRDEFIRCFLRRKLHMMTAVDGKIFDTNRTVTRNILGRTRFSLFRAHAKGWYKPTAAFQVLCKIWSTSYSNSNLM